MMHRSYAQTGPPTAPDQPLYLPTRCLVLNVELVPMWMPFATHAKADMNHNTAVAVGLTVADMDYATDAGVGLLKSVFQYKQ